MRIESQKLDQATSFNWNQDEGDTLSFWIREFEREGRKTKSLACRREHEHVEMHNLRTFIVPTGDGQDEMVTNPKLV